MLQLGVLPRPQSLKMVPLRETSVFSTRSAQRRPGAGKMMRTGHVASEFLDIFTYPEVPLVWGEMGLPVWLMSKRQQFR